MICECSHHVHVRPCEQPAARLTYDRDPRYVCSDCTTETDSRPLTEASDGGDGGLADLLEDEARRETGGF